MRRSAFARARLGILATVATLGITLTGAVAVATPQPAAGVPYDGVLGGASRAVLTPADLAGQVLTWSADTCTQSARAQAAQLRVAGSTSTTECARARVPLSWDDPSLGSITVQVTRVKRALAAGDARPTRTLFVNPGGPGAEAGPYAVVIAQLEPSLSALDDIVAVDPRGTGGSTPAPCAMVKDGVNDYRNPSAATIAAEQRGTRASVVNCVASFGWYLPHITTRNTVRDHDLVRGLLGVPTVDWYGVSAGTWLATRYAEDFPTRVGRAVLDSNTNTADTWDGSFSLQPKGFQRRFEQQFVPWAARHPEQGLGSSTEQVKASYERIRGLAAAGRFPGVTANDLDNLIVERLYSDDRFPMLAKDLSGLLGQAGAVPAPLAMPPSGAYTRVPLRSRPAEATSDDTVFMALPCNDTLAPREEPTQIRIGRALGPAYPLLGWSWMTNWCNYWPYLPPPLKPLTGNGVPPMLMVQNELDPATPYEGAVLAERAHPALRLLTVDNAGAHGAFTRGNLCVENAVRGWLIDGVLPAAGTVCPGTPLPGDSSVYEVGLHAPLTPAASSRMYTVTSDAARLAARMRDDLLASTPR